MNIAALARSAYSDVSAPIKTERSTEYQIFAQITHRLTQASTGDIASFIDLAEAIHENRRLWTVLASDVVNKENGLPAQLRAQIFYLAEFTENHSTKVLSKEATTVALVEINTAVMRGLRASGATP
ncbi:flagellar biosynthesis regulator FlhF [Rhodobacterales bacterium 52_120_T64]|nr:flagellar biosynthesis regulator FlhF [Rhodobacterales bacterium 52_120_T64]